MIYLEFIFPHRIMQVACHFPLVKCPYSMLYSTALPSHMTVLKNIIHGLLFPILGSFLHLSFISFSIPHSISQITNMKLSSD